VNLRHLRAFAAIADLGGFARAAPALHLSQPALSRQIHALEEELGVQLFDRVGRGVQLTSEGEDILRRSRRLLIEAEALGERARALKGGVTGILRVGATPQVIENQLASFIAQHKKRHPGVEVHLVEEGGQHMADRLARGDVQLACVPAGDPRFAMRLLAPMHLLAVFPQRHRLAKRPVLEFKELADEPLLVLRPDFASRAWFDAACQVARVHPQVLLESRVPQTLVELAATAYGVAIVPSTARLPKTGVRAVPLLHRGAPLGRWLAVGWDPQRFLAPYAAQFVDELVASVRLDFPGRDLIRRAPPLPKPKESAA
jgi:LysR family transcriptional regulator, cyn operon transcriptional activator